MSTAPHSGKCNLSELANFFKKKLGGVKSFIYRGRDEEVLECKFILMFGKSWHRRLVFCPIRFFSQKISNLGAHSCRRDLGKTKNSHDWGPTLINICAWRRALV